MALIALGRELAQVTEEVPGQEVTVCGRLDVDSVAEVRLALHNILDRGVGDLLIHLALAEVHDSTGLGVIVGVHHRARLVGRRLVLVDVSPRLDRLLHATRLHRFMARAPGQAVITATPHVGPGEPCLAPALPGHARTVVPFTEW